MNKSSLFYWHDGNKILLNPSASKRAIKFSEKKDGIYISKTVNFLTNNEDTLGIDLGGGIVLFDINAITKFRPISEFEENNEITELLVFGDQNDDSLMILTDEIIVKLKSGIAEPNKLSFLENYNHEIKETIYLTEVLLKLIISGKKGAKVLDIANDINMDKHVLFAHPNFTRYFKPLFSPNDFFFPNQWALLNVGQNGGIPGNDINAVAAWNKTIGANNITIAIIDEGVDYSHKDLNINNKLIPGYDALTGLIDPNPENNDAHGTACAGIAAGAGNNKIGIVGVAPGCKILGIRIAKSIGRRLITNDLKIADGIEKAYALGADILSNSWGFTDGFPSTIITTAIRNAKKLGRNGKGCIVCFAAGNNNSKVLYPGTLSEVITVAACNEFGEHKTPHSSDGENWWGSNFGPEVDICAPGVHIITTDITGSRGYTSTADYYEKFNGTSAATPHVAGVAALVLSVNPNLTASEVENILRKATDNLGSPGYNIFTGFGRINALKAVRLA